MTAEEAARLVVEARRRVEEVDNSASILRDIESKSKNGLSRMEVSAELMTRATKKVLENLGYIVKGSKRYHFDHSRNWMKGDGMTWTACYEVSW